MSKHKDVILLSHSMTDRIQTLTQEAGRRQCHELHLTYPNIISKPGEVLLRAVVITDLLVAASWMLQEEQERHGKKGRQVN